MNLKELCSYSLYTDKHLDRIDALDQEFSVIYSHAVNLFKDELENNIAQEDIYDDLYFEIQIEIERLAYSINVEDVMKAIYRDYNIKEAS